MLSKRSESRIGMSNGRTMGDVINDNSFRGFRFNDVENDNKFDTVAFKKSVIKINEMLSLERTVLDDKTKTWETVSTAQMRRLFHLLVYEFESLQQKMQLNVYGDTGITYGTSKVLSALFLTTVQVCLISFFY